MKHVQKVFGETVHSEEAIHGISAFAQRTNPNWVEFHKSKL